MAAADRPSRARMERNQYRATPALDQAYPKPVRFGLWNGGGDVTWRHSFEQRSTEPNRFQRLVEPNLHPCRHVAVAAHRDPGSEGLVGSPGLVHAQVATYPRGACSETQGAELPG